MKFEFICLKIACFLVPEIPGHTWRYSCAEFRQVKLNACSFTAVLRSSVRLVGAQHSSVHAAST